MIYDAVQRMFLEGRSVDPVTILEEIKALGYKEKIPRDYVLQLVEITPHAGNVLDYAKIVRSKSMLRELQQVGTDIVDLTRAEEDDADTVADLAEQKVYAVRQGREIQGVVTVKVEEA